MPADLSACETVLPGGTVIVSVRPSACTLTRIWLRLGCGSSQLVEISAATSRNMPTGVLRHLGKARTSQRHWYNAHHRTRPVMVMTPSEMSIDFRRNPIAAGPMDPVRASSIAEAIASWSACGMGKVPTARGYLDLGSPSESMANMVVRATFASTMPM